MKVNITLICPVYNVREYLEDTFGSIEEQTDKNFNIVIVDDCSTDGSGEMCDDFAKKWKSKNDSLISVIHNKCNRDASYSRELGVLSAETPFIYILDSDDLIHPKLMEMANKFISKNISIDMIINKKIFLDSKIMKQVKWMKLNDENSYLKNISDLTFEERYDQYHGPIANRFIRKSLITSVDYSKEKQKYPQFYFDDGLVTDMIFHEAKNVYCIDAPVYYYRVRQGGIGSSAGNFEHQKEWTESDKELLQCFFNWGEKKIYKRVLLGYIQNIMKYYYIAKKSKRLDDSVFYFINTEFAATRKNIKINKCEFGLLNSISIFLFGISKNIWTILVGNVYFKCVQKYKRILGANRNYNFLLEE